MSETLLFLCFIVLCFTAWLVVKHDGSRNELTLTFLTGIFVAYPLKNFLLYLNPSIFVTYPNYWSDGCYSCQVLVYVSFILFLILFTFGYALLGKRHFNSALGLEGELIAERAPAAWGSLNLLNSLGLFLYIIYNTSISSVANLLSSDIRKEFLLSQVGSGWSSLLIVFTIPLLVLSSKFKGRFIFYLAFLLALFSLLAVGSRMYLFGYLLAFYICRFRPNFKGILFVLIIMGAVGSLIYMGFLGDPLGDVDSLIALSFLMHTFDGADILNIYLNKERWGLYFGSTIIEDLFITYFPRVIWEDKPYLFGGIRITADMMPDLQNVKEIMATFPPGLFLETYANFSILSLIVVPVYGGIFAWVSDKNRLQSPFYFAFFVSLLVNSPGFFRGIGSVISFVIPIVLLLCGLALFNRVNIRYK
jgi:hypothetical protein